MHILLVILASLQAPPSPCDAGTGLRPSRDLYCIELFPAAGVNGPRGTVGLVPPGGPFTVAVTVDGRPRVRPVIDLAGLPAPSEYGPYSAYVAWATTPVLDTVIRAG